MEDIWNLLKEYDFALTNKINIDFVCILCKKILINPRVGPCGCRYCKICIEDYLENSDNICPGTTDECKEENLNLIRNINIDHCFNRKIAKLKLYCPIENCTFSDQIINMKQHLIGCRENAIKCPLFENGCNFISLSGINVNNHYKMTKDKHLELVLTENVNINNTNKLLKKRSLELELEIEKLQNVNKKLKSESDSDKVLLKQKRNTILQSNNKYNEILLENKMKNEYQAKYEKEIISKNNLKLYLCEYLKNSLTKFIWKIPYSNLLHNNNNNYILGCNQKFFNLESDEFYIYKNDISMKLKFFSDKYTDGIKRYTLSGNASHYDQSLNNSCPFIANITIGFINKSSGNFILRFYEKKSFGSSGISFEKKINNSEIENEIKNNHLTVKCLIRFSL